MLPDPPFFGCPINPGTRLWSGGALQLAIGFAGSLLN